MAGVATALLWLYCSVFLPHEMAHGGRSLATVARIANIVTIVALIIAPVLPMRSLFPRRPVAAAVTIGWMPLALALSGDSGTQGLASTALEGAAAWLAIVLRLGLPGASTKRCVTKCNRLTKIDGSVNVIVMDKTDCESKRMPRALNWITLDLENVAICGMAA